MAMTGETSAAKPDDPAAHALYDRMIAALRAPQSLTYTSHYRWRARGSELGSCTYRIWLSKPNFFRLETTTSAGEKGGVLIGDGTQLWIHWPKGRPVFSSEVTPPSDEERVKCYLRKPAPIGGHSVGHEVGLLGAGMCMTIIDPSTFHGYTDSLQPHLDGVTARAPERVGDEPCDVIEVSYMGGQRVWKLWIAQRDHLPRKLHEVVHVSYDIETDEEWSDLVIDTPAPRELFMWRPPEGFKQWQLPAPEDALLKPGARAPDFELNLADGATVKLADYRGKVVWLVFWRVG
jgi:outer membrane lipoprotein-sorting protein